MDYLPVIASDPCRILQCNGLLASKGHCYCQILAMDYWAVITFAKKKNENLQWLTCQGHCYCQILAMDYWPVITIDPGRILP